MISLEAGKHLFIFFLFIYFFLYITYIYSLICDFVLLKLIFHRGNNVDAGQPVGVKMHSETLESIKIF